MRRRVVVAALLATCCIPAAAQAAGRIDALQPRIEPLQSTIRDQATRIEVTETGAQRAIAVPSDVLFAFDSARISPGGMGALREVGRSLGGGNVTVVGHTDSRGAEAYNDALSRRRAQAVVAVLRATATNDIRFVVRGAGEKEPVTSNRRAEGRRRNRRVEILVSRAALGSQR
jgi:outer membrane protein OmpA-like peptidoglycan-associated protein